MSTAQDIGRAVERLDPDELAKFRAWFAAFDADAWDEQIDADASAGRLDDLAAEALADLRAAEPLAAPRRNDSTKEHHEPRV